VEFDGIPLEENGMEMTDESSVSGGMSGKIHSVRASENADDGVRGGGEERGGIS